MNRVYDETIEWLAGGFKLATFLTALCIVSCTGFRPPVQANTAAVVLGANNTVISQSVNSRVKSDGTGKLIIKGKNNLIKYYISDSDIESYNSKTVTIIEGDNNNISSTVRKCVLFYKDRTDTVLIKGNQLKIDFAAENIKQLILGSNSKVLAKPYATSKNNLATGDNRKIASDRELEHKNVNNAGSNAIVLTRPNNPKEKSVLTVDSTDKDFDWSTTEGTTKLTGFEKVYVTGLGKDLPLLAAIAYYTKQAQQDNYEACYQLGLLYNSQDFVVLADLPRAVQYYERAARHNHAAAAFHLGQIYEFGDFELGQIIANRAKAKYYYSLAAQNGSTEARDKLAGWHD